MVFTCRECERWLLAAVAGSKMTGATIRQPDLSDSGGDRMDKASHREGKFALFHGLLIRLAGETGVSTLV